MAKNEIKDDLKLEAFPEEITEDGIKIYGETSYENQMAVLSHYLHNNREDVDDERKEEIILAVREFLSRKKFRQDMDEELSDEQIWMAAESPLEYNLFDDFFKIPFPAPENPRFTFIDLFAGMGGFRIAMQRLGGKCVYSSEFKASAQQAYLANYGEMPFGDITKESTKRYIPDYFDILCAGFPCQAFSAAGARKGFADETRGTLFLFSAGFFYDKILRKTGRLPAASPRGPPATSATPRPRVRGPGARRRPFGCTSGSQSRSWPQCRRSAASCRRGSRSTARPANYSLIDCCLPLFLLFLM